MNPSPKCCNTFYIKGHNCYRENLKLTTENCDERLSVFYNSYMCAKCKSKAHKRKNDIRFQNCHISKNHEINLEIKNTNEDNEESVIKEIEPKNNDEDYVCISVDNNAKKIKLMETVKEAIFFSY